MSLASALTSSIGDMSAAEEQTSLVVEGEGEGGYSQNAAEVVNNLNSDLNELSVRDTAESVSVDTMPASFEEKNEEKKEVVEEEVEEEVVGDRDIRSLKVTELRTLLKAHKLSSVGNKEKLVQRWLADHPEQ